jgi:hypothetical protein
MAGLEEDRISLSESEPSPERITSTPAGEGLHTTPPSIVRILSPVQSNRNTNSPLPLPPSPLPDHVDDMDVADFPPPTPLCNLDSSGKSPHLDRGGVEQHLPAVTPSLDLSINKTITPSTNDRTFVAEPTNEGTPYGVPKEFRRDNVSQRLSSRLHDDSLDSSSRKSGKEIPKLDPYVTYENEDLRITFV